ncbi:uncharacterized protein AMSG_11802 [Thecamonas trahens ATCC 50062]|uniref:Uncharacterized protein n=1 Tax=Thecamonas trahens ATCC 50062 TaxID=461836 RepID=A0A0L0D7R8_THETB|nr:hypothetical protein AMSG_11802 [Thecamonas trahens ATCC 50062]KNC48101.1 hypothetical protein AMSG_11802 [Thecamonas trahens ATCC 50062]|eukprot:XP_013758899.1 hypothetical protein AMSG_11802 [Thecamonas trahens ATCC 50062]
MPCTSSSSLTAASISISCSPSWALNRASSTCSACSASTCLATLLNDVISDVMLRGSTCSATIGVDLGGDGALASTTHCSSPYSSLSVSFPSPPLGSPPLVQTCLPAHLPYLPPPRRVVSIQDCRSPHRDLVPDSSRRTKAASAKALCSEGRPRGRQPP